MALSVLEPLSNVRKTINFKGNFSYKAKIKIFLYILFLQICIIQARHCDFDQFMCKNGKCLPQEKLCDGSFDCSDNSDEIDCDLKMCRKPDWFQCALPLGPCLSSELICNGVENCPSGEDELDCVNEEHGSFKKFSIRGRHFVKQNCSQNEFTCQSDKSCIPLNFMCDDIKDCPDGSDETIGCVLAKAQCKGFFCNDKRCLETKKWLCDGIKDCEDGSDETNCTDICTPEMDRFLCHNNITCLSLDKVCDGKTDCPDGSDESVRCTATNNCSKKTCPIASKCQMMPLNGPECICPKGYRHSPVDDMCVDINECLEIYGACSQTCVNLPGSYKCICDEDYTLREDNHTCQANGEEALLLYTIRKEIRAINLRSKRVYTVARNLKKVIGVSYSEEHIYWTNVQSEGQSIVKANRDGTQPEDLVTVGLEAPEHLAVDWLTGNIYFSDRLRHHIAVCSNNGHFCTVLVTDNVHRPRSVVLWPQRSQIFWTDWGNKSMIVRASMDGSNSIPLVTEKIQWPNGIALDMYNDRIYWVDGNLITIESARSDGSDRRLVLEEIVKHPYGLAIFEDHIYWSDWVTKSIHSCNKFTGKDHKVITKDRKIYDVHIYHSSKQKKVPHACERSRCTHLCLLAENNTFSCACPDGMRLRRDQLRCISNHKNHRLFLGVRNSLLEIEHTKFGRHTITKAHKLNMLIHELAYNSVNNTVFVADNYHKHISEVDLESSIVRTLIKENIGNVTALAYDHMAHNLYWSDSDRQTVEVLSLQTNHRALITSFSGLERPIGLAIVPYDGIMFVALKSGSNVYIDGKYLDGSGNHSHLFEDVLGDDYINFAVDIESKTLYWADTAFDRILFSDYRVFLDYTFRGYLKQPYSVAVVNEDLFWTQLRSNTIHWAHKSNMGSLKSFDLELDREIYAPHLLPTHIPLAASITFRKSQHPCQYWNGFCSHICVTVGGLRASCLCPPGLVFYDIGNHTCVDPLDCEFLCRSGECVSISLVCNNRQDCIDNSDEKNCKHKQFICPISKFMCKNTEECLEAHERCDGKKQCKDGTDEEDCENFDRTKICHQHQYLCDNGNCVDLSAVCDGRDDCGDNSEELICQIISGGKHSSTRPVCDKDMFQCNTGSCIANSWECDGHIDCIDGSDEHEKCDFPDCPRGTYKCHLSARCVDELLVCDGHNDCEDSSDELNCDMNTGEKQKDSCGDELNPMYRCASNSSICLDLSARCNGSVECPHGEDEADCADMCKINEFQCKTTRECILSKYRCDNGTDCADGSDEENCFVHRARSAALDIETHEQPCGSKMWNCQNGKCIDESRVCDGIVDCDTGNDEGQLCKTACEPVDGNKPCENKCKATPSGPVCSCFNGFKLDSDNRSCYDINECEEQDPCAQICDNIHGSYRCSCYPGFMLRTDKITCKSIESKSSLLFSTYNEVRRLTEHPLMLKVAWKTNDSKIISFDLNIRLRQAYFITENENIIHRIDADKGEINGALELLMPEKLAVDWITDNVYVISRSQVHTIQVCSFSAKMCGTILKAKPHEIIKTLAVDAYNRRLFFVIVENQRYKRSHSSRIVSATLDGNKQQILVSRDSSYMNTLTCDPYKKVIYYTDMRRKILQSISYRNGSKTFPETIMSQRNIILYPFGLTWYENEIFIVNLGDKEALRCSLFGDNKCKTLNLNILNAQDITVDGSSRQPMNRNPCEKAKCQGICIQSEFSYECMCGGLIVSETRHCNVSNELTSAALFTRPQTSSSDVDEGSSHVGAIIWTVVIFLLFLICIVTCINYRRKRQFQRDFYRNLVSYFQNRPASLSSQASTTDSVYIGNGSLSDAECEFKIARENIQNGTSLQNLFQGSMPAHSSEILLQTTKPHELQQMVANEQQLQLKTPLTSIFLVEDEHDFERTMVDYEGNGRTRLVP